MTSPGKRVQTINPPGSEVGPDAVATWGTSLNDEVDTMSFKWKREGRSSKPIPFSWEGTLVRVMIEIKIHNFSINYLSTNLNY